LARLTRHEFDRDYLDRLIAEEPETELHFTRYFGDLLTIKLRSRLRSAAQIDDVRQETFVRVLAAVRTRRLASPGALGAFVNSVCNNVLLETYRSGGRVEPLDDTRQDPVDLRASAESALLTEETRGRVRAALASLPDRDQQVLRMLFFDERDKDEICRELQVDRNYLRVLLHRAKTAFRQQLADDEAKA
jgi:RNA polymerase sigma-70 factor (ECF subfamily)